MNVFTSLTRPRDGLRCAIHHSLCNLVGSVTLLLVMAGCATWQPPIESSDASLRERAQTITSRNVRVSATVLSADDRQRILGVEIDSRQMQPVWVEVQNRTQDQLWLLRPGTDPDYFSPLEVAWSLHKPLASQSNERIDQHFDKLGFKNPVLPGATTAGLLFIKPERGTRFLNIDLLQRKTLIPFTLFLKVPDDAGDKRFIQNAFQYPDTEIKNYKDIANLQAALERHSCCAADAHGTPNGDPINAIFIGEFSDIAAAFIRRSYRRDLRSMDAAEHVFGRKPDAVVRKESQAGAPATWVRVWLAPIRFEGRSVYLAQVGRPVGGRFASMDQQSMVLHEDVDEARNLLIQDMMYSAGLEKLALINGVGLASQADPRTTFNGARYHSDGLRAVMFFAARPLTFSDVQILSWEPFPNQGTVLHQENRDARK